MNAPLAALVVMGVSGSGKTTLAAMLAGALGWPYRDADDMHPPANVAKMRSGRPLDDADRAPWLAAIAAWIDAERAAGGHAIVACSALKRAYRDVLIGARRDVGLIFLDGSRAVIHARMAARAGHYMPPALLDSQIATLEPPTQDEEAIRLSIEDAPDAMLAQALAALAPRLRR
ncbi:MAG: gluconokinase [Rhodoblastus sp.]|nr:MAG: gluconokinase [Rhodoblastus sp.]